ncbi:flavin reductase family protein [Desulfurobacterium sp.]
MKVIEVAKGNEKEVTTLIFNTVVPRPIAWITTISACGVVNLAPFSFYNAVTTRPPLIFVSIGKRKDGKEKDTARNIIETGEFVVNVATKPFLEKIVKTGESLPPEESEVEKFNIETAPALKVKPPIVKGVPAALECKLRETINLGDTPMTVVIGEVVAIHYTEEITGSSKGIIGRLGGKRYAVINDEIEII